MQHHAPQRLDQLADRDGVPAVVIYRNDDQAAELVLAPVFENRRCQRAREADHHDCADLLLERHSSRAQDGILFAGAACGQRGR